MKERVASEDYRREERSSAVAEATLNYSRSMLKGQNSGYPRSVVMSGSSAQLNEIPSMASVDPKSGQACEAITAS